MPALTPATIATQTILSTFPWSLHKDIAPDPNPDLIESINRFGLLRPVIVKETPAGHELICGARRFIAVKQIADLNKISAVIIDQTVQNPELLALIAEDQKDTAPLSPIETARLITLSSQCDPPLSNDILQSITGISSQTRQQELLTLLKLEEPIRTCIHQGRISVKTGLTLATLAAPERIFLFNLFNRLALNANKQRRLIELSQIISVTEQCSISEIFTSSYKEFCSSPIDNIPQATNRLMKNLYEHSHPRISKAQKHYQEQVKNLNLPKNCHLTPSPAFERDTVTLEVEFESFSDLSTVWKNLKNHLQ